MPKSLVLLIHSVESSPSPIAKQLEARDFSVHLSRTIDDAERVFSAFPADQIKFVFVDVTLCHGSSWSGLLDRIRTTPSEITAVCYHPKHDRPLCNLLGYIGDAPNDAESPHSINIPPLTGETPSFQQI